MYTSWAGGQLQGILIGFPSAPLIAPSQSPVPVGLTPELNPNSGASRVIVAASRVPFTGVLVAGVVLLVGVLSTGVVLLAGVLFMGVVLLAGVLPEEVLLAGVLLAGGFAGVVSLVPSLTAFCKAPSLVDANGQPFPGPFKFWIVMDAAVILADSSCFESPVGKETLTEGLLTANPA